MATRLHPPKKVRLACQRCRTRRVKCDGEVPACTNCAKAGEVCLDIDSQNPSLRIPRNFAATAQSRLQWLESIIRDRLPEVDLEEGPGMGGALPPPTVQSSVEAPDIQERDPEGPEGDTINVEVDAPLATSPPIGSATSTSDRVSRKRPATSDSDAHQSVFPERAHRVAVNLGMLSLNSESNQRHYLGSSSGRLFANLIGASPSTERSNSEGIGEDHISHSEPQTDAVKDSLQQRYHILAAVLRRDLPTQQDAKLLLQTFFTWIHPDYPIFDLESLHEAVGALFHVSTCALDVDLGYHGWPSSVAPFRWNGQLANPLSSEPGGGVSMPVIAFNMFMVFNIASIIRVRSRIYENAPERFYRAALCFSQDCFAQISLPSIQALVTLSIHATLVPADVNLWTLLHIALAHCVELGIHREEVEDDHGLEDAHLTQYRQARRFVFFTIYSLDRSIASIQGRPLGFRDETFDIKFPTIESDTSRIHAQPNSTMAAVTRYSTSQYELDYIISDIKLHLYHLPGARTSFALPNDPWQHQSRIKGTLSDWKSRIPSVDDEDLRGIDRRQRQIWHLKLEIRYHTAMLLLYQPSQAIRDPNPDQLITCYSHASSVLKIYQSLHDIEGLHFDWRSVHSIFAAGATVVYCFWMSSSVRQSVVPSELTRSLRTCSSLLALGGEWWPSAKRGQSSFGPVVDLTVERLFMEQGSSKMPRLSGAASSERLMTSSHHLLRNTGTLPAPGLSMQTSLPPSNPEDVESSWVPPQDDTWHQEGIAYGSHADNLVPGSEMLSEAVPEIESFLADFDRSNFSWTFPLDDSQGNFGDILTGPFP